MQQEIFNCTGLIYDLLIPQSREYSVFILLFEVISGMLSWFNVYFIYLFIIVLYIKTFNQMLIENAMDIKILKCRILKFCHMGFVGRDRIIKLILKGLLLYLEPNRYLERGGFLLDDKSCMDMYMKLNVYLKSTGSFPDIFGVFKRIAYNNVILIVFVIIFLCLKKHTRLCK